MHILSVAYNEQWILEFIAVIRTRTHWLFEVTQSALDLSVMV